MSHFAEVVDGVVRRVIVAEQDFIDLQPGKWVQCSYNTRGGVHLFGGAPLRKNYPGPGFIFDSERDAFYEPRPYPSWVLDEDSCVWGAPIPLPDDGRRYFWDEKTL